jgi:hypothetical protein
MIPHGRGKHVVVVALLILATALAWLWMRPAPREFSPDAVPRPSAPFGPVTRDALRFHWLLPNDEAPVAVEVLDAARNVVWRSAPSRTGTIEPSADEAAGLPEGDAYWRPVAVPAGERERPGELAAIAIRRR